ncbi:MAG: oxygen-independent coproporphyrinogen III oxidase [Sneathiella sp.]|uniref:oxygen-independent coproporphyrinogen III oxidase n=1 Tax=Sneathiella sp. TaxID=1964365 RepID=UPI000C5994D9|nr:oxygen-independent coproporphyrinogen III oxidase [Sneathiella sp.]MAZ03412.1 oxygen-independent coproporphyrinogen III oxidase [Sneathiella sp.]
MKTTELIDINQRVPRYTSYPTAPHFHTGVSMKMYCEWLETLEPRDTLSLYFHIPYCQKLCWFCGCHTKIVNHYEPILNYLDFLEREVELVARHVTSTVQHVHFGGGSPTILKPDDFLRFMDLVRQCFTINPDAEIAVEMDPRNVDEKKIAVYAQTGVTRASLGVQDFNPRVQKAINRVQSYTLVRRVVETLRAKGINALNLDLIYGLPFQTLKSITETIEQTLSLEPSRISLFGYAHVPWMKKHQKLVPEEALPDSEQRRYMYEYAASILKDAGYIAIGLDHFAQPHDDLVLSTNNKTLQRNFQGYTTDTAKALIGMGVSAISSMPQGYVQNTTSGIDYAQIIKEGDLPLSRGIVLTEEDKLRRDIIMALMCTMEAPLDSTSYSKEMALLKPYIETGDVSYEDGMLKVHPSARNRLRMIASIFDSYLSTADHRYSCAS